MVVTDEQRRKSLAEAANHQAFVAQAPVVIAACAESDGHVMRCGQPSYPIDVAIAIDHITLQAAAEGLGTCWIGAFLRRASQEDPGDSRPHSHRGVADGGLPSRAARTSISPAA